MSDVFEDNDVDATTEALLKRWEVKEDGTVTVAPKKPQHRPEPEPVPEPEEVGEDEAAEEDEAVDEDEAAEEDGTPASAKRTADDEDETEIKVGDEVKRVKVADLKRLFGQEASLTQKSQAVAEAHRKAEETSNRHLTALTALKDKAQAEYEPYGKIDWVNATALVSAGQLSHEEFTQLRQTAQAFKDRVDYFGTELDGAVTTARETQAKMAHEAAKACLAALNDKDHPAHIEGFTQPVYDEMRGFAVKHGVPEQVVNGLTDPAALKLIHMAMQFQKQQSTTVQTAKTKLAAAPKNVAGKSPANSADGNGSSRRANKAMDALRRSGSPDDAADALMARWGVK